MYRQIQYLKYLWNAKTRHGVHSPFVYAFIEQVLRSNKHKSLKDRIMQYFDTEEIKWLSFEAKYSIENTRPDTVAIIEDIHTTPKHTMLWEQVVHNPEVTLSLDVFDYGILLFKPEFKEKQHFVVKG
jgi:hypothetical protein